MSEMILVAAVGVIGGILTLLTVIWKAPDIINRFNGPLTFNQPEVLSMVQEISDKLDSNPHPGTAPSCVQHAERLASIEAVSDGMKKDISEIKDGIEWLRRHNGG